MSTSLIGNDMRSSADMGMTLTWIVEDVSAEGVAQIDQTINRLTMRMQMPGDVALRYDSAAPLPPEGVARQLAQNVGPLVGVRSTQQMTDRGELIGIQLTKQGAEALEASSAGASLKGVFSQEGLKSLFSQAVVTLPSHPVKPGDTWHGASEINSPAGTLVMQTEYTYRGTETHDGRLLERIDLAITLEFGDGPNAMRLDVTVDDQRSAGTMYFDAALGRFVHSKIVQKMTIETRLGEQVHRQQLDSRLKMTISDAEQVASRFDETTTR